MTSDLLREGVLQPEARWRSVPNVVLHWKLWEDQYVVYNSGSGHTHVLDPVAALLVRQMTESCCEASDLLRQIATLLDIEITEEFHSRLCRTLWQLEELGLVEVVTS